MLLKLLVLLFLFPIFESQGQLDSTSLMTIPQNQVDCVNGKKWVKPCPFSSQNAIADTLNYNIKRLHSIDGENKFFLIAPDVEMENVELFLEQHQLNIEDKKTEGTLLMYDFTFDLPEDPTRFDIVPVPFNPAEGCWVPCEMKIELDGNQ